jgi:hypothetical protein
MTQAPATACLHAWLPSLAARLAEKVESATEASGASDGFGRRTGSGQPVALPGQRGELPQQQVAFPGQPGQPVALQGQRGENREDFGRGGTSTSSPAVVRRALQARGADAQWCSSEDDDREPDAVSVLLYAQLTFLSPIFKRFGINTLHSLRHRSEEELYEKEHYIRAQGHPVGTMTRLRELVKHANDECTLGAHLRCDTAPAPVSNKLAASMTGRRIGRLLQVLVTCDVLSYEALSILTDTEFEEVCMVALAQGFELDETMHLANLRAEARNTCPGCRQPADDHHGWCGAFPPGLGGLEPFPAGEIVVPTNFNWERFMMSMLGKSGHFSGQSIPGGTGC